ncbi:MAG: hypothetical protein SVN78_07960 [Deferribacterota bacterium]|nr:hypothetical protein [Deferribacterota bacterium]
MKFSIAVAPFNVDCNAPIVLRGNLKDIIKNASMLGYNAIEIHFL